VAGRDRPGVLFAGTSYYHTWYASRALRKLGWRADVLNVDPNPANDHHYHGFDRRFVLGRRRLPEQLAFVARALNDYDIFHFSNAHSLNLGPNIARLARATAGESTDVAVLKRLGKKIAYSTNGCLDGVSQTSFSRWPGPEVVCDICRWRDRPDICSDSRNLEWGQRRNRLADVVLTEGGNRADWNDSAKVRDVPQFYCLDPDVWRPDLEIPPNLRLPGSASTVRIYHAVGNYAARTASDGRNIKSTHVYIPLVERLKHEGHDVELMFFDAVPNLTVRYYQAQADIVVDMLSFGWFGGNVREAMMLGKPAVCYIRPEWLETVRRENPGYAAELPIVSATPDTAYEVVRELVRDREKREEIGRRSRAFALKYHSAEAAGRRLDALYRELLAA
jgi:glycosyltransferase involved in cell wall biosynthesis